MLVPNRCYEVNLEEAGGGGVSNRTGSVTVKANYHKPLQIVKAGAPTGVSFAQAIGYNQQ